MSMKTRITSNRITELHPDEIFVFGSNLEGAHVAEPLIWHGKNGEPSGDKEPDCKDKPMVFRLCTEDREPSNLM